MGRFFFLFIAVGLIVAPLTLGVFSFVEAGSYQLKIDKDRVGSPDYTAEYQGIVPCGKCTALDHEANADLLTERQCGIKKGAPAKTRYLDCQLCHGFVMADDVLDTIMWRVVPSLAILFFFIAGFFYMASGDDPMKRKRANDVAKSTVIGILLIYGAWIIVNTIFSFTPLINTAFFQTLNPTGWFTINCPISY